MHIYLIEDDLKLAKLIQLFLLKQGFTIDIFNSVADYKRHSATFIPALIICDVMLPDGNGFELFQQLSTEHTCPIIFLTALDSDQSHIKGLNLGAYDYLIKPLKPELLLAKINAILRQSDTNQHESNEQPITLNHTKREAYFIGMPLNLNDSEFEIIAFLIKSAPHPVSREMLFKQVIGRNYNGLDRAIDLKISRLRKKLTTLFSNQKSDITLDIKSVRSKGYCLDIINTEKSK
ncbi:response regulator transcription factor [Pseudoalteromonas prydzensis]|uniref:response regulator transcription factor n=1 Tax=Pseudoalteromonas prydzensis TaxID=182141 RepID=UPI0007E4E138|nr:response regulator transcription factor [Pseudoalteromonas prydzensis]MBE0377959.1 hypothetical protein [Pseudoalteromonas prydzensis ACAM 620]